MNLKDGKNKYGWFHDPEKLIWTNMQMNQLKFAIYGEGHTKELIFNEDLKEFTHDTVPYCKDAEEFTLNLNEALQHDNEDKVKARIAVAEENTWKKRMKEFSNLLSEYLKKEKSHNVS